mmetsp:Transcript_19926/g.70494  ORF Transcript_19926/g.70494 Transcript_19926/m.70494 type:complete len:316 (+) Transcript_19926:1314-2261(+)
MQRRAPRRAELRRRRGCAPVLSSRPALALARIRAWARAGLLGLDLDHRIAAAGGPGGAGGAATVVLTLTIGLIGGADDLHSRAHHAGVVLTQVRLDLVAVREELARRAERLQHARRDAPVDAVVVNVHQAKAGDGAATRERARRRAGAGRHALRQRQRRRHDGRRLRHVGQVHVEHGLERQDEPEHGAVPLATGVPAVALAAERPAVLGRAGAQVKETDVTAERAREHARDRKAEAGAVGAARERPLHVRLEQRVRLHAAEADARVLYREHDALLAQRVVRHSRANLDVALHGELAGVGEAVGKDLAHAQLVLDH